MNNETKKQILSIIEQSEGQIKLANERLNVVIEPPDPTDVRMSWFTPELHKLMNLQGVLRSFFKNITPAQQAKTGKLTQYLPFIAVIVAVIAVALGFMLYNDSNFMKQVINEMQIQIGNLSNAVKNMTPP